jgi:putative NADPH-quinone reductase
MKILYVNGHPYAQSYHAAIRDSYVAAAKAAGHDVEVLNLGELSFDPVLRFGYGKRMPEDAVIDESQRLVKWADHIVFAFPIWWGTPTSLLTGWIERVFTPGFSYHMTSLLKVERFLVGRTADIIITSRAPRFAWLLAGNSGAGPFTHNLFLLTGIKKRKIIALDFMTLKPDTQARREKFLARVAKLARSLK